MLLNVDVHACAFLIPAKRDHPGKYWKPESLRTSQNITRPRICATAPQEMRDAYARTRARQARLPQARISAPDGRDVVRQRPISSLGPRSTPALASNRHVVGDLSVRMTRGGAGQQSVVAEATRTHHSGRAGNIGSPVVCRACASRLWPFYGLLDVIVRCWTCPADVAADDTTRG